MTSHCPCLASMAVIGAVALSLAACNTPDDGLGLLGDGTSTPFPSSLHFDEDGRLDVDRASLPIVGGSVIPSAPTRWRRGVSPAQTFVVQLSDVQTSALPSWRQDNSGLTGVRALDVDSGEWWPVMAELDAYPDQASPVLLIRPLKGFTPGHTITLVVTTDVTARSERFDELVAGKGPTELVKSVEDSLEALEGAGLASESVALAWSVPIEDGTKPLAGALQAAEPGDVSWTFDDVNTGEDANDLAWRSVRGTLTVTGVLTDGGVVSVDADSGAGQRTGTWETDISVHIPEGVENAEPGTVPVVLFGHGIFGTPEAYFAGRSGPDFPTIAKEGGVILVGVPWRGLSRSDLGLASGIARDITRMPELTSLLLQSQVSVRQLSEAIVDGDFLDDPIFLGASGQPLPRRGRLDYLGVSLGGIQGAIAVGMGAPFENAVLHVPGSMWGTMLERSSNFALLEAPLVGVVESPADRQRLYAWTQLYWDYADPMATAVTWNVDTPILLQESLHDEQVPNLTTRALARTLNVGAAGIQTEPAWGVPSIDTPTQPGTSAWVQHDPERAAPDEGNRPAVVTNAHDAPRGFAGVQTQILTFLRDGVVVHPCGNSACSPVNPGE